MNKKRRASLWGLGIWACLTTSTAFAAGDPDMGEGLAGMCEDCHGAGGNSDVPDFPKLAGQYGGYIAKQIRDFQSGKRSDDMMSDMAMMLESPQDMEDVGAYYEKQKQMTGGSVELELANKGMDIYNNGNPKTGLYGCVNCHGKKGKGLSRSNSVFPIIGGQHKDYLMKQLRGFKSGTRTNDPAMMMVAIAKKMSDKEIEAVAEYLSGN